MVIFVLFLGSWIPYICTHFITYRYLPLFTHSVLPFLVMSTFINFFKTEWNRRLLVFFGFALSGHLVNFVLVGSLIEIAFPARSGPPEKGMHGPFFFIISLFIIFINGIIVFFLTYRTHKKLVSSKAEEKSIKDSRD